MENFVRAQKHFLDVIAEVTAQATGGKKTGAVKKMKKAELSQLARQATESFIEAQKKLVDVAGKRRRRARRWNCSGRSPTCQWRN
jgi:hypothetical protein